MKRREFVTLLGGADSRSRCERPITEFRVVPSFGYNLRGEVRMAASATGFTILSCHKEPRSGLALSVFWSGGVIRDIMSALKTSAGPSGLGISAGHCHQRYASPSDPRIT
jgi:hypothetical protein